MGIVLVLTVTPFVSTSSSNFMQGVEQGLFVKELSRIPDGEVQEGRDSHEPTTSGIIPPALTSYKVRVYTMGQYYPVFARYTYTTPVKPENISFYIVFRAAFELLLYFTHFIFSSRSY